jgi:hypothetical protein
MTPRLWCWLLPPLTTLPLAAQPRVSYSTYLGGSGRDTARRIAADLTGGMYVAGSTDSTDFLSDPTLEFASLHTVHLARFDRMGALVFARRLPVTTLDAMAVDDRGFVYVAGRTVLGNQATAGSYQETGGRGTPTALLMKLAPDGGRVFATYFGSLGAVQVSALYVDRQQRAVVCGQGRSDVVLVTATALQDVVPNSQSNGYCAVFSADGSRLEYGTLLPGGPFETIPASVTVDAHGALVVAGSTTMRSWPGVNAVQSQSRVQTLYRLDRGSPRWTAVSDLVPPYTSTSYPLQFRQDGTPLFAAAVSLAVSRENDQHVCTVTGAHQLRCSWDAMQTWETVLFSGAEQVVADPSPLGGFLVATRGVWSLAVVRRGVLIYLPAPTFVDWITTSRSDTQGVVDVLSGGWLWRSVDGSAFEQRSFGFARVYAAPTQPSVLYALRGWGDFSLPSLVRSDDGGVTWQGVGATLEQTVGDAPFTDLVVDPEDSRIVYLSTLEGVYRSRNGGDTWDLVSAGLVNGRVRDLEFDSQGNLWAGADRVADAFAIRILTDQSVPIFSTLLGGEAGGWALQVDTHEDGRIMLSGLSTSRDFPVTTEMLGDGTNLFHHQFVTELAPSGELLTSRLYRLPGRHEAVRVAGEQLLLGGYVLTEDRLSYLAGREPGRDAHWMIVDLTSGAVQTEGAQGGSGIETVSDLAAGAGGVLCLVGTTASPDWAVTANAWQGAFGGMTDGFFSLVASTVTQEQ